MSVRRLSSRCVLFCQAEDGIRSAHYLLQFRRVLFRSYRSVDVRAYSNQPRARLSVNGRDIGWTNCIDAVCVWKSVRLDAGAMRSTSAVRSASVAIESYGRSEEHTSDLQSLMRISYAVFFLKTHNNHNHNS